MPAAAIGVTTESAGDGITGLVLAGGRGSRMADFDKGLVTWRADVPLALHAARRLAPQVRHLVISANRNLDIYRAWRWPVVRDGEATQLGEVATTPRFDGPLAGLLAGMRSCRTPLIVSVPCDVPMFPLDLVARLAAALGANAADAAVACSQREDGGLSSQPVFALMRITLLESLSQWIGSGESRVMPWLRQVGAVEVVFEPQPDQPDPFANANTVAELSRLQHLADRI